MKQEKILYKIFLILKDSFEYSKRYIAILYDYIVSYLAFILSIYIRLGNFQAVGYQKLFQYAAIYSLIQIIVFISFGLYRGIWRFASIHDLKRIIQSSFVGVSIGALVLFFWARLENIPRSTFIIDWFVLVIFLGMGRFTYRLYRDSRLNLKKGKGQTRTLIVGAGLAASQLLREIFYNENLIHNVIGLVDDNPNKRGKEIFGIPVLGYIHHIPNIIKKYNVQTLIIAIPSATSDNMRRIIKMCVDTGLEFRTLPNLADLVNNKPSLSQIRPVTPEDLLGRASINLENHEIKRLVENKTVLVTGAGGSIGSELCRQIFEYYPTELVLFDNTEFFLFNIEQELKTKNSENGVNLIPCLGNVKNGNYIRKIFQKYQPQVVLHAAAYKHVPLMEFFPIQALENNVLGTYNIVHESIKNNVESVVIISTDKAINPTNVMGASKRLSEIVARSSSSAQKEIKDNNNILTKIITVRFGNVLGSNGSVIPIFKKQIEEGGPVTVTNKDITRYFMSIEEASHLVLEAATMGQADEIFVLDMGKAVKIIDLAKEMIALSGLVPDKDINIEITGLRPGEKLHEELLATSENTLPTHHEKILKAQAIHQKPELCKKIVAWIQGLSLDLSVDEIKLQLRDWVPEYKPEFNSSLKYEKEENSDDRIVHFPKK